jgi:cytochrome P450
VLTLPQIETDVDAIDLSAEDVWTAGDAYREAVFKKLRDERPISFHEEMDYGGVMPQGPGYWALTRHADVIHASRHPDLFASGRGGSNIPDLPDFVGEFLGSIINMDAPKHTKLRLIVNRGFTPRMVSKVEDYVRDIAREIVAGIRDKGEVDFVVDVAAPLPLRIICDMLGIPRADNDFIFEHTNAVLGGADPEYGDGTIEGAFNAANELAQYAVKLGEDRLAKEGDDITSTLMHAEVEGERLTTAEFGSFFVLLVVAGNETTRNAISHGLLELTRHPDQRQAWQDDFHGLADSAIEEIVRWATPVIHFRRTVTEDTEIDGHPLKEGEKVVLFYNSANRDERYFDDPFRFDIRRTPNEHVGFGAGGPHFCLGANLARREIKVLFEELWQVLPDIEATGEPSMLLSNFIHGIKHLKAEFTPK